jgi:hypothetical protein
MKQALSVAILVSTFWATSLSFSVVIPSTKRGSRTSRNLSSSNLQFDLHPSILDISAKDWDSCLSPDSSPFLQHSFLKCLEEANCVSPQTGWVPSHVSISSKGQVVGFVPLYVKMHSMGEFIFDSGWAEAAQANNISYYPKLLVGVPFTPATCPKVLIKPSLLKTKADIGHLRKMLSLFLKKVAQESKCSSVHINFLTEEEASDIAGEIFLQEDNNSTLEDISQFSNATTFSYKDKDQYHRRTSIQYHWSNSNSKDNGRPYRSFDEYLKCFKSKRRISIRRERQKVQVDEDIQIDAILGKVRLQKKKMAIRYLVIKFASNIVI